MAVSTIPMTTKIGAATVSIAGVAVTNADGSWYYSQPIEPSLPTGALAIGVSVGGNFSAGVIPLIQHPNKIILQAYKSMTMPSNRTVVVYYALR